MSSTTDSAQPNHERPARAAARDLRHRLSTRALVCDGAMGTMLHAAGASLDHCLPELNLTRPEVVSSIHRAYLTARADIIETNTFGANRVTMERFGLANAVEAVNSAAVRLAKEACEALGSDALVAGSIAPAVPPRAAGRPLDEQALNALVEQAEALQAAGVDLLVLETFGDLGALVALVGALSISGSVPVVAQVTFLEDGRTMSGDAPETVAGLLEGLDVAAIGANCTLGPRGMRRIIAALSNATSLPLVAQPNAGPPSIVRGHLEYRRNEEYFAREAAAFVELGASIVGGCCGTTPQHIDAVVRQLRQSSPSVTMVPPVVRRGEPTPPRRVSVQVPRVAEKLANGDFILGCELPPPDGSDPESAIAEAAEIVAMGADALVVAATPHSRASISPVSFGLLLLERLGIEPILTVSTFDKSILGLQADLLGAHAFGLQTVICTTATPPPQGDYPELGGVFTVSSVELIEALAALNDAREHSGTRMRRATTFSIGAQVNPSAADLEWELARTRVKLAAGAAFLVTDPVFSLADLGRFVKALDAPKVPLLLGVTPLHDFGHAEYLHYEVPGINIPEAVLDRLRAADDDSRVGTAIAAELVLEARELISGVVVRGPDATSQELRTLLATLAVRLELAGATTSHPR